jgi:hypothetical protein
MGFNGYDDAIQRTRFNPLAWGDQNLARIRDWQQLEKDERSVAQQVPSAYRDAYFELVQYPIRTAAAQNYKFLYADRSYLDAAQHSASLAADVESAHVAYAEIQSLTAQFNSLRNGKWSGIMSSAPRDREVFKMPKIATAADAALPLPGFWTAGSLSTPRMLKPATTFVEQDRVVSINASHFTRANSGTTAQWRILPDLGISSGGSVVFAHPGVVDVVRPTSTSAWLDYEFSTESTAPATLTLYLLPTFPIDSQHTLRYAVQLDDRAPVELDASGSGEWHETSAPTWAANILRNAATATVPLGPLQHGIHTLRLLYRDPAVVFQHLVITFPGAAPAYPVPPETTSTLTHGSAIALF